MKNARLLINVRAGVAAILDDDAAAVGRSNGKITSAAGAPRSVRRRCVCVRQTSNGE